jgi:glycosyltransferase involved in cell wall biosynthesis
MKSKLWADGVVAISRILAQRAMEAGCPPDRVIHIPTGAAVDRIRPVPVKLARSQLGIPQNRRIVGFIGMGQGDLDIVMNALRRLPDVWLMVIGGKNPRVIEQARSFGVDGRLWQTGFARDEEVELYLGCANIMCLPMKENAANRGRLPNKILDYMCAGRPTVASSIGDIRMIVDELEVGVLSSDDCFAEAIDNLFADAHLREFLGDNARRAAETVFNWSNLMDRLEDFYFRIVMR